MTQMENKKRSILPLITAALALAGAAASIALLYTKVASTLSKLDQVLDIYLTQHEQHEEEKRKERLRHDYDGDGNLSI